MNRLRVNFVGGQIEDDPLTGGALVMTSQALAALPIVTLGQDYIPIVIDPDGASGHAPEIVWITEHEELGQTATIIRGQEGSEQREHHNDEFWIHAPTAYDWSRMFQVVHTDGYYPGTTVFVGTTDPEVDNTVVDGDIWIVLPS